MRMNKTLMLTCASLAVLGIGTSKANAFDDVDWNWDKNVTSTENITVTVNDTFDWSGLVEIEKIQANIGDVTATSTVTGVNNNPPSEGSGSSVVSIDDTFTFQVPYEDATDPDTIIATGPIASSSGNLQGTVLSGEVDEGDDFISDLVFQVTGEFDIEDGDDPILDAVDLPEVASVATAVGNNQSIVSTSAVNLHDAQYNLGGFSGGDGETDISEIALLAFADQTDNTHTDAALGLTIAGALGLIEQGEVSATSTVSEILNASVDSKATAVGNNFSLDVQPALQGDAFALADLTQFNYANISASSSVSGVDVNNYTNLAVLDKPLVNSVATAVGNNVSISVGNLADE